MRESIASVEADAFLLSLFHQWLLSSRGIFFAYSIACLIISGITSSSPPLKIAAKKINVMHDYLTSQKRVHNSLLPSFRQRKMSMSGGIGVGVGDNTGGYTRLNRKGFVITQ